MNIGLYFGSFNPIHLGHLIIAKQALNNTPIQKVWFVVSPQNPLKNPSSLLPPNQRLLLTQLATEDDPFFKTSNIEFKLPQPSYTIHTLTHLSQKYPQHTFFIIMGADSFSNLPKWKNADQILQQYSLIVYPRPPFILPTSHNNITILDAPILDISASFIRNLIKHKKSIQYLVPEKVRQEIETRGFYKNTS